jgi:hypothetical protein
MEDARLGFASDRISVDTGQLGNLRDFIPPVRIVRFLMIILMVHILIPSLSAQESKKPNILVYSRGIAGSGIGDTLESINRSVTDVLGNQDSMR